MLEFSARGIMAALLGAVCLFVLGVVAVGCGAFGGFVGAISLKMAALAFPTLSSKLAEQWIVIAGAALGATAGVSLLVREWWTLARASDDPTLRLVVRRVEGVWRAVAKK